MEHRCERRERVDLPIKLATQTPDVIRARVRDISPEGMFIQTHGRFWREYEVVRGTVQTAAGTFIDVKGIICHASWEGMGIMLFSPIDPCVYSTEPPLLAATA